MPAIQTSEIRLGIINAVAAAGKGHLGGGLSCAEILACIFTVKRPDERFIMSKGHAASALYSALADLGYFDKSELLKMNQGGMLGEHPDLRIPGVSVNSGSLGHGLGLACGMALGSGKRVFVLMGDGECQEGSVWESAMFAAHHRLPITLVIDRNGYQVGGATEDICALEPLDEKWRAFGWNTINVEGHNETAIIAAMAPSMQPVAVIANTIKGMGVSFMKNRYEWHHGSLTKQQADQARAEINGHA